MYDSDDIVSMFAPETNADLHEHIKDLAYMPQTLAQEGMDLTEEDIILLEQQTTLFMNTISMMDPCLAEVQNAKERFCSYSPHFIILLLRKIKELQKKQCKCGENKTM